MHQQNLSAFRLAIVVLSAPRNSLRFLQPLVPELRDALAEVLPGQLVYALTNTGQGSCSLAGFPGFAVLGSGGEALDGVRIVPSGDSSSGDESPPGPVFLAPGEQAVFDIRFTGIRATALRAAPPTPAS